MPGALGIVRPAQPPTRAPLGVAPPPRAIQGPQVASGAQPAQRPSLPRRRSRHSSSHAQRRSSSRDFSPRHSSRTRARAVSRPRSRTPLARRRTPSAPSHPGPPGSWQPNSAAADPYQEPVQQPVATEQTAHHAPYYSFPAGVGAYPAYATQQAASPVASWYYPGTPSAGAQTVRATSCTGKAAS